MTAARELPLYKGEELSQADERGLVGARWVVRPKHVGHTIHVVGRIVRNGSPVALYVAECSCGDRYRIAAITIEQRLADEQGVEIGGDGP